MDEPVLGFEGVRYAYPDGTAALDGVTLHVRAGDSIALLGPNGAGKSTLILHGNGLLRASSGSVSVCGTPVSDATVREARRRVGLVFQDPDDQLFMPTLFDDIAFGPLNMGLAAAEVDHLVHEALHAVGLEDCASRPAQHLSFGQRKRAALATVLSMSPEVLLLDEPTSNLDPRARRTMTELLAGLSSTRLVATHDMQVARALCRRAVVLDAGRVVADGPIEDVLSDRGLMETHGLDPGGDW